MTKVASVDQENNKILLLQKTDYKMKYSSLLGIPVSKLLDEKVTNLTAYLSFQVPYNDTRAFDPTERKTRQEQHKMVLS
ncbi:uncharacterized protein RSE6_10685 [Rhynchosporium secalis]|uniref:Uncharacterized protein n=1 Tax=Rhynchosporium secalis TaxID=38038 RepID=A0A1E1ML25_RHYSE|nr:uncharacterized protein RSE6_10685 [Rhynchosporium secalis]